MPLVTILLGSVSVIAFLVWYLQPTLRVTRVTLPVRDLPASLEGFKIAQLSDIHYDLPRRRTMTEELLNEIIQVLTPIKRTLMR